MRSWGKIGTKKDTRGLEGKGVEGDGDNNIEHMWEQAKRVMKEKCVAQ